MYPKFRIKKLASLKRYYSLPSSKELKRRYASGYVHPNPKKRREMARKRRNNNLLSYRKYANEYMRNRRNKDPKFRIELAMRMLVYRLIGGRRGRTSHLLGYSSIQLKEHLGRFPRKNESLDHKIPVTWFLDLNKVALINHLHNLQILTKRANSMKLNSFAHPVSKEYFELIRNEIKPQHINQLTKTK